jgi:hypothetical protein
MKTLEDSASKNHATHPLDAMAKAPGHHEVLLENDKVRVLDTRVSPGDRTPDSRTMDRKPEIGAALWAGPIGPHYVQNVGQTELRIIAVEAKPS